MPQKFLHSPRIFPGRQLPDEYLKKLRESFAESPAACLMKVLLIITIDWAFLHVSLITCPYSSNGKVPRAYVWMNCQAKLVFCISSMALAGDL